MTAEIVGDGFNAVGKGGTIVLTGLNKLMEPNIQLPGTILTLFRKSIKGSLFGDCNPTTDIPKILGLYQSGDLKLDEIITRSHGWSLPPRAAVSAQRHAPRNDVQMRSLVALPGSPAASRKSSVDLQTLLSMSLDYLK